ncbi:MAG: ribonuclease HI family protein [Solirubrobacterales bacterium]|nr:ribonuclease HI family protein [Solirubrobacterales bacterium]
MAALKHVVVHVDGGARGNPGLAAAAAVATDPSGGALAERARTIGDATNNVAEYEGVLLGIELARELGASRLELIGDSELVARQIKGEWKVKQPHLKPFRARVMKELAGFESWSIRNVPREQNEEADALLNQALDEAA